jgi:propanol-preferring alcohol dehydrogenase
VVISGIGGLGHVAVQYAKAMGLHVIAVDISDEKIDLARKMGADQAINAKETDAVAEVKKLCGGADGVLVTAVSPKAFSQALGMLGKRGTMSLVGLPPGSFPLDIFDTVLTRKTIRGSIVGTRLDLAECLAFAGEGKVKVHYSVERLDDINSIFGRMRDNKIDGRVVMRI